MGREKGERERKKNRKWPWEDYERSRDVNKEVKQYKARKGLEMRRKGR